MFICRYLPLLQLHLLLLAATNCYRLPLSAANCPVNSRRNSFTICGQWQFYQIFIWLHGKQINQILTKGVNNHNTHVVKKQGTQFSQNQNNNIKRHGEEAWYGQILGYSGVRYKGVIGVQGGVNIMSSPNDRQCPIHRILSMDCRILTKY